eukprot:TRINITY_DN35659_c0_g1_i2.p1 TRINITY_DN35659_c0_g1~~TRINITY_DN35659_c0_g1_i2.p1  ORF type:complete len:213 (-),score=61.65 TRINITY_DN35659_c0_g1_i2:24-662(-)
MWANGWTIGCMGNQSRVRWFDGEFVEIGTGDDDDDKQEDDDFDGELKQVDSTRRVYNDYGEELEGFGTYFYPSGSKYTGDWENGTKHGLGKMEYYSGNVYVGEWMDNRMHGKGTFTYIGGNRYTGDWFEGKRHGKGKLIYGNGRYYVGEWKFGKRSGKGKDTSSDQEGIWDKDKFVSAEKYEEDEEKEDETFSKKLKALFLHKQTNQEALVV